MRDEDEEFFGAEQEPVANVSWWPTVLWILGMIVLFNIVAGVAFYLAVTYKWINL
jgi:heme/copper-type cytochrome/quinol oxidase subunit 2